VRGVRGNCPNDRETFTAMFRCLFRVVAAVLQDAGRQPPEDDMEESLPV